jgi:hypothetical protein
MDRSQRTVESLKLLQDWRKWLTTAVVVLLLLGAGLVARGVNESPNAPLSRPSVQPQGTGKSVGRLQPNSLCANGEHIIFSCAVKRTAKLVSLCASPELTKERGYLQYRFGLPGKIELEFPKDRQGSQQQFRYSHYFRFQVDLTEIKFAIDGFEYSIFDDYNGEEKPPISSQGVSVTAPGKPKDANFICRSKPKADYSKLQDVLANDSP